MPGPAQGRGPFKRESSPRAAGAPGIGQHIPRPQPQAAHSPLRPTRTAEEPPLAEGEAVVKKGFLWKESRKGWKMRFIELDRRAIAIY